MTEVDGLRLWLSFRNGTGYLGVTRRKRGGASPRFCARMAGTELGCFKTLTDAAIAYAQHRLPVTAPDTTSDAEEVVSHIVLPYG